MLMSIESRPTYDGTCGINEEFVTCGIECERSCSNVRVPQITCNHMCAIGCFCVKGFVRRSDANSACIRDTEC
ncbi:unnamed protein product [Adineta ricciae]|uniref:TIL domain-containing protein n=1 Tax=Adineta ricciae TaxID=249248 RepID=A0A813UJP8_ADIRI|nr:unnamed protein product [Adineta ricciae]